MVKIVIENLAQKVLIAEEPDKTALHHFHSHRIDWMHACGGKGRCTTCKMIVLQGMDNIEELTPAELKYREERQLKDNERLACQSKITGAITIRVPEESKLPHLKYTA